jgi:hypothetical protein
MPGVPQPPLIREDDSQAPFLLTQYLQDLNRMARNLTFLDSDGAIGTGRRCLNIDAVWVRYVSNAVANTEDTVAHNLSRVPVGIWVSTPDKAAVIYKGTTAWTDTNVFLKSDVLTTTVDLLLF